MVVFALPLPRTQSTPVVEKKTELNAHTRPMIMRNEFFKCNFTFQRIPSFYFRITTGTTKINNAGSDTVND
jgi:hypothetical protein